MPKTAETGLAGICPLTGEPCTHRNCNGPVEKVLNYQGSVVGQETIINCGRTLVAKTYQERLLEELLKKSGMDE